MSENLEAPSDLVIPETVSYGGEDYTVTAIEPFAFYFPDGIRTVRLPVAVTDVGDDAFLCCMDMYRIEMPGVEPVGYSAFSDCYSLLSVDFSKVS